jgi:ankyrin repeat protein
MHQPPRGGRPARTAALLALAIVAGAGADEGGIPIVDAARAGDRAAVRRLIERRADVNASEPDGTTALHWAARADDREMMSALLRAGARPAAANRYGVTPLRLAAVNGSAPAITMLLDAGVNPDGANAEGETALMTAARAGSVEAVRVLAARGANVNARETWFGETAMMWAAAENHAAVVRALASLGGDVDARSRLVTPPELEFPKSGGPNMPFARGGWTPLMYAAREGAIDAARALAELGADVDVVALPQTDVPLTPELRAGLEAGVGTTALVYAIINAHFDLAAMLLEHGADPNIADHTGMAALYAAVEWNTLQWVQSRPAPIWTDALDGAGLVKRLLARGADPNAVLKSAPPKISLDPGATLNFNRGATPLMRAARTNDVDVMRLLLDGGADPRAALPDGTTVLMIAAGQGLGGLRGEGPRIRVPTEAGAVEAVRLLLDRGVPINAANNAGATALHAAVSRGERVVRLLAERGADVNARNKFGQTPLDLALGAGGRRGGGVVRESTAALLREFGAVPSPPRTGPPAAPASGR